MACMLMLNSDIGSITPSGAELNSYRAISLLIGCPKAPTNLFIVNRFSNRQTIDRAFICSLAVDRLKGYCSS